MTKKELERELYITTREYIHFERSFRRWHNIALKYKARLKLINADARRGNVC